MFTGIIEAQGEIARIERSRTDARLYVRSAKLDWRDVAIGDSIAVNGVCLTAVDLPGDGFEADVSGETLQRTTLGGLKTGSRVNLEKALTPQTRLGGHLVSGHVDGVGVLLQIAPTGQSYQLNIQAPGALAKYIAEKGSICIDGISLTVNRVKGAVFELNIVPHTLQMTTLSEAKAGCRYNLEVDILARYVERLLSKDAAQAAQTETGVDREFLSRHGFMP